MKPWEHGLEHRLARQLLTYTGLLVGLPTLCWSMLWCSYTAPIPELAQICLQMLQYTLWLPCRHIDLLFRVSEQNRSMNTTAPPWGIGNAMDIVLRCSCPTFCLQYGERIPLPQPPPWSSVFQRYNTALKSLSEESAERKRPTFQKIFVVFNAKIMQRRGIWK